MVRPKKVVHQQPEDYKWGWVHGFYDAKSDDGAFYGDRARPNNTKSDRTDKLTAERLYDEGYRDGQSIRRSGSLRICQIPGCDKEPQAQTSQSATEKLSSAS